MLPISTAVALGWREVLQPLQGLITGTLGAVSAGAIFVSGLYWWRCGYVDGADDRHDLGAVDGATAASCARCAEKSA